MSRKYFGTDGIRGLVGEPPMTPDFALKLGWAAGIALCDRSGKEGKRPAAVIGKDTRLSGYMFESALEAGFSAAGVDVLLCGPMPTPAIAYLARTFHASVGVVISASHNPFHDNGVKFFSGDGMKLPDEVELQIEKLLDEPMQTVRPEALGKARRLDSAPGRYIEFCKGSYRTDTLLEDLSLVVDCGHGATYHVAPSVFRELGARVSVIGDAPDGLNINENCGATATEALQKKVVELGADAGIALDGDGDRCIMVDAQGNKIDGDQLLYIIAMARHSRGKLKGPVVGTQMSNLGVELALKRNGILFERAKVGDRYVMERLLETDGLIGGESSGHLLCLDRCTTGDGIVSALQVLQVMVDSDASLAELVSDVRMLPQILINVPLQGVASEVMQVESVQQAVQSVESELGESGRVLLRPSGTEPLIRVMVEGADQAQVQDCAERIAERVRQAA